MNKFWIVFKHTFKTAVRTKSFLISTILTSVILVVVMNMPAIISYFTKDELKEIGVIDPSNQMISRVQSVSQELALQDLTFISMDQEAAAKAQIEDGKIKGYLIFEEMSDNNVLKTTYKSPKANEVELISQIQQVLNQIQLRLNAEEIGVNEKEAMYLFQAATLETAALEQDAKSAEEIQASFVIVYLLIFAIYLFVLVYGNMVAMEIAKEKTSRVMEILVSSVNPITQLFGKILGIGFVGMVQTLYFILVGYLATRFGEKGAELGGLQFDFSNVPLSTVLYAILFFILGFLMYGTMAAMIGSLVSRIEDMQQMLTPLTMTFVVASFIAFTGLGNPDSMLVTVTSFIPIFTPLIMFVRIGMSNPALWEIVISILLLLVTIVLLGAFTAKVYRGGVLMYGKSSFKDVKKALKIHQK